METTTTEQRVAALEAQLESTRAELHRLSLKLHYVGGVVGRVFAEVDRAAS